MTKQRTVLVIDDEPELANLIKLNLTKVSDYRVLTAYSGSKGLAMIRDSKPDLVILDILMDDMSGFQVIEMINSEPTMKDIPVILMSILADDCNTKRAMSLGALDFMSKPINFEKLQNRLTSVFSAKKESEGAGAVKKVLIVEDDFNLQTLIQMKVAKTGAECHAAHNGLQALQLFEKVKPDVILLDLYLPDMTGVDIIKKIYTEHPGAKPEIVIITARYKFTDQAESSLSENIKRMNIDELLSSEDKFAGAVQELLNGKENTGN